MFFFLLRFSVVVGRSHTLQVFYRKGHGHAGSIVGISHPEVLREAEEHTALLSAAGHIVKSEGAFFFGMGAHEKGREGFLAFVELGQHGLELFAVFRVEICLSLDELVAVFADVENLGCREFCATGGAAGAKHVGRFVTIGIKRLSGDGGDRGLGECGRLRRFGIHGEEQTVGTQCDQWGCRAMI